MIIELKQPPPLKPGDLAIAIAPSGALRELADFEKGLEIWRDRGYRIELGNNYNAREGYLAGDDLVRREALKAAWENPECKAIVCVRGGYGSARLLEDWNWSEGHLKWVIGFSDVTGLLWSLARSGIMGIHGPVLTTIAQEPEWSLIRLFRALEGHYLESLSGNSWHSGKIRGPLLPANLTVATHLLGTSVQPNLNGVILALEDVTEAPYRIDRMLTQWRSMGILSQIGGIALGRFSRCDSPRDIPSWSVEEVLRDRLRDLNIPIVAELPFGHDGVNAALPVGTIVELDGDRGRLEFFYPCQY
jgi:muramoyltetrapeptide carboxypeptidase